MAERGEYRSLTRALLHGKDYRKLPERARHVLLNMKILFGPAGIEVFYPESLRVELRETTGIPARQLDTALAEIEGDWIRTEGNVVWIIEQLRFDPHMKVSDWKHRLSVQRHIAGMPRLQIICDFADHYIEWFFDKEGASMGLPRPLQGPSKGHPSTGFEGPSKGLRSTKQMTEDETENKTKDIVGRAHAHTREEIEVSESDISRLIMAANTGMSANPKIGDALNPIDTSHGSRQVVHDWLAAGMSADLLEDTIYESAFNYQPNDLHRQISTMRYFDSAVKEQALRDKASTSGRKPSKKRDAKPQSFDYSNPSTEFKGFTP